jgi:pimeloyl-ACP methyl ester carboxylesterase
MCSDQKESYAHRHPVSAVRRHGRLPTGREVEQFKSVQERLLAKSMVTAKSQFVKLMNPRMTAHVLDGGKGEPVLLIHGGNAIAVQCAPMLVDLQREFRWYAPDRPGTRP